MIQLCVTNQTSIKFRSPFAPLFCMSSETLFFLPLNSRMSPEILLCAFEHWLQSSGHSWRMQTFLNLVWERCPSDGWSIYNTLQEKKAAETKTTTIRKDPCESIYPEIGIAVGYSFLAPSWSQWALFQWPEGRLLCPLSLLQQGQKYPRRKVTTHRHRTHCSFYKGT